MAYAFAGAWYVDSEVAVQALRGAGCNTFIVPGGLPSVSLDATLAALQAGEWAIVDVSGFGAVLDAAGAAAVVQRVAGRPNIIGYLAFDEPNNGGLAATVNQGYQRQWYNGIKTVLAQVGVALVAQSGQPAPGAWVFVNYRLTGTGFPDAGAVVATRGVAWDAVMVDAYPLRWGVSDMEAGAWLTSAAARARATFPLEAWILPIQQAAGCSICPQPQPAYYDYKAGRSPAGLLLPQWQIWKASGCLDVSHTLLYYGWGTVAASDPGVAANEDISLKWGLLGEAASVIAAHRQAFGL